VSSSITGLKRTSTLDKSSAKVLVEAKKLMSPDKSFQAYRKALNASSEPCVPWLRQWWFQVSVLCPCPDRQLFTGVHLKDAKAIHDSHQRFIKQDGHTDVINFQIYHRVHECIRDMLSYQDSQLKPADSVRHAEMKTFVEYQLQSLIVNESLRDWLQERGSKLAREEKAHYDNHRLALKAAGFIRSTMSASPREPHLVSS
jgi:hypothetical protein